jgi:ribosomal-protein-alanine N-acetyltransferase
MTANCLDAVLAVESSAHLAPWTRGNFLDSLAAGHNVILMQDNNDLLGYAVLMPLPAEAELLNITITPAQQGRGWGRALLEQVCATAAAQGAQRLFLEVRASNQVARQLYARSGFAEVGLRKGYYASVHGQREDAILMVKGLGAATMSAAEVETKPQ